LKKIILIITFALIFSACSSSNQYKKETITKEKEEEIAVVEAEGLVNIKNNDILLNDDIENNPTVWRKVGPYTRYSDLRLYPQKENMIYIQGYDSLFKSKVIWFAKPKNIVDVVEIEKESNNHIALSNPSPNPAINHVKTRLYWDKYLNIENASFQAYNVLGLLVSERNQFYFDKINSYSGDLTWKNDNLPDGVYLIVFQLDNNIRSVPVVISK